MVAMVPQGEQVVCAYARRHRKMVFCNESYRLASHCRFAPLARPPDSLPLFLDVVAV